MANMSDSIEVREATPTDGPEVMRLLALLGHAQPDGPVALRFDAFVEQDQHVLVATRSPSGPSVPLLGAVTLHITPVLHRAGPIGRLTAVVVDESARGKGIGRALVEAAERFFAEHGCVMVELTSNKKRTDAHAFYERLGYTATSFRFAKPLAPADKGGT
jgi:GNAT superfamily N-acetyltransferase